MALCELGVNIKERETRSLRTTSDNYRSKAVHFEEI